ncbi:hypothetical protein GA0074695_1470 [Micromonospora viridifaciens]|uniref:Uncharacterized protein n=1 Tax=Micromonospora viridifaciens TaxID=1881 RepID=A0A1C4VHL5_MICVI|nr:hypothetical protein [Micromonospora viridifaciens]SCE83321.1 hypothetical protein GA0074695_1470 [Micromonospora viridifaciens]
MTTRSNDNAERRIWIPARFLDWGYDSSSSNPLDAAVLERAYSIWNHASGKLDTPCTEFDRVDVVTTLKRAVTQRVSALKRSYGFHLIPLADKPKRDLDMLYRLGLIRPIMLRNLIEIRNTLEHEDAAPPDDDACVALSEFVWYFLKSTDPLLKSRLSEITYVGDFDDPGPDEMTSPDDYPEYGHVHYLHPTEGPPLVIMRLPKAGIRSSAQEGYLEVVETSARRTVFERDDLTIVEGSIVGPADQLERLWLGYFQGLRY